MLTILAIGVLCKSWKCITAHLLHLYHRKLLFVAAVLGSLNLTVSSTCYFPPYHQSMHAVAPWTCATELNLGHRQGFTPKDKWIVPFPGLLLSSPLPNQRLQLNWIVPQECLVDVLHWLILSSEGIAVLFVGSRINDVQYRCEQGWVAYTEYSGNPP